ncbi:adaptor protein MecA [Fructilactobacillus florum]|uniref:adaptor protein MecA n=1 Tax=Fructilactobacillus florum TaxID=640331 RepID=UPI000690D4DD|nr:adaptor protein MecA [Fructilactobacillus florum]
MKFKKTNEDTIKVWVDRADLKKRHINLMELVEDQYKIEDFFYQILEEVDVNHEFSNNELVSFQVMPVASGFELIISKDEKLVAKMTSSVAEPGEKSGGDEFDEEHLQRTVALQFTNFDDLVAASQALSKAPRPTGVELQSALYRNQQGYELILTYRLLPSGATTDFSAVNQKLVQIDNQLALGYEYGKLSPQEPVYIEKNDRQLLGKQALPTLNQYFG